jgi:hypothetical protein
MADLLYRKPARSRAWLVSTAQAHYEALLAETRAKGGPTPYTHDRMPPGWDGRYTNNVSLIFGLMRAGRDPVVPPQLSEPPQ